MSDRLEGLDRLELDLLDATGVRPAKCRGYRQPTAREVVDDAREALDRFAALHDLGEGRPGA